MVNWKAHNCRNAGNTNWIFALKHIGSACHYQLIFPTVDMGLLTKETAIHLVSHKIIKIAQNRIQSKLELWSRKVVWHRNEHGNKCIYGCLRGTNQRKRAKRREIVCLQVKRDGRKLTEYSISCNVFVYSRLKAVCSTNEYVSCVCMRCTLWCHLHVIDKCWMYLNIIYTHRFG